MAKSKSFFSLRRGSTKSHTYSVLNGQQITKDRVSEIRNPRTEKQMLQRSIMATVMAAYSAMKGIEDHAFQNKSGSGQNQSEFMSRNLNKIRSLVSFDYQAENSATDCNAFLCGPKTNGLVPNPYVISRGTQIPSKLFGEFDPANPDTLAIGSELMTFVSNRGGSSYGYDTTVGAVMEALGMKAGDQITFVYTVFRSGTPEFILRQEPGYRYNPSVFGYDRIVVNEYINPDDALQITTGEATAEAALTKLLRAFLGIVCNEGKTSVNYSTVTVTGGKIALEDFLNGWDAALGCAFGVIFSNYLDNTRSNSDMVLTNVEDLAGDSSMFLGLSYEGALAAWYEYSNDPIGFGQRYLEGGSI